MDVCVLSYVLACTGLCVRKARDWVEMEPPPGVANKRVSFPLLLSLAWPHPSPAVNPQTPTYDVIH